MQKSLLIPFPRDKGIEKDSKKNERVTNIAPLNFTLSLKNLKTSRSTN